MCISDVLFRSQIVAVIMCNTGVALLAYMDGIAKTPTLGSVVMGATGAAGSAAYKVRASLILPTARGQPTGHCSQPSIAAL